MRYTASLLFACLSLAVLTARSAQAQDEMPYHHVPGVQRYFSPDQKLRAVIVDVDTGKYWEAESIVKIETPAGRVLATRNYFDGGLGHTVVKASWTPDSHFFVYSLESSGGHSPWHSPMHFYSRHRRRFFGIDDYITGEAVTNSDFRAGKPSNVWVQDRDENCVRINLRHLERIASFRSEYDNY